MFDSTLTQRAAAVLDAARAHGAMIVTAESCTGGLVAAALTAIPGSSDVVDGGFVTYANEAKLRLGVPADILAAHGAVSEEVARALATAARAQVVSANGPPVVAVSVTGVAGPGGGSVEKPVGLVHFAAASPRAIHHRQTRFGDIGRDAIRRESVLVAFDLLEHALSA